MNTQPSIHQSTNPLNLCLLFAAGTTAVASGAPTATLVPHPDSYQIGTDIQLRANVTPGGNGVSRVEFFAGTVSLGDGQPVWDGRWEFPDGSALGIMHVGHRVDYNLPNSAGMFAMSGSLTTPYTFDGTFMHWPAEGGEASGAANILLSWAADGTLNAAINGDAPLGRRPLTGGVGTGGNPYAMITFVENYHYFNGGVLPGTIALQHRGGTVYGPWQTAGRIGQAGVANAYWAAWPMAVLPAGTYTVIDSSPSTWSHNSLSGNCGFTIVKGIGNNADASALLAAWTANCGLVGAAAALEADPDGDGRPNWVEASHGGHPMQADPTPVGMRTTMLDTRNAVSYLASTGRLNPNAHESQF
jgi:hypothetical protein